MSSQTPTEADYVEVKKEKKPMSEERLQQLQKARELAVASRKDKAELKSKEKALAKLELETKKKEVDERLLSLNVPAPKKEKKEKKIVYVDSSSSSEEEIEYVKRPKKKIQPIEKQVSRIDMEDQLRRLRKEQMMRQMFSSGY